MELKDLLAILWKRKALVILVVVSTTALSTVFALSRPPTYESVSTLALTPDFSKDVGFVSPDTLDAIVGTYAQTAKSTLTLDRASRNLGRSLPGSIDTSTEPGTGILRIIGRAETSRGAALTARAATKAFVDAFEADSDKILKVQVVNPAMPSLQPVQPRPPLIIGVGILLGLLGGAMLAFVVEQFRGRIETGTDISAFTDAPVIGRLPRQRNLARSNSGLVWDDPEMVSLHEAFRALRTNIQLLTKDGVAVLQVTSPLANEGKSTVVANLGVALAQIGVETLIVDADLRRPTQHQIFKIGNHVGLSTLLENPGSDLIWASTEYERLSVLPSGPIPHDSTEMLAVRFPPVLESLRNTGALVLVDSPPILPVSDARLIAERVDAVLLVLAAGSAKPATLRGALEKLAFADASLLGMVLNYAEEEAAAGGYDYYRAHEVPGSPVMERPPVKQ